MTLDELHTGKNGIVVKVKGRGVFRKRIMDMGFVRGTPVTAIRNAPLKDPVEYRLLDYYITLRRTEARLIEVIPLFDETFHNTDTIISSPQTHEGSFRRHHGRGMGRHKPHEGHGVWRWKHKLIDESRRIEVALVGNPNCGKTSIFNLASKAREHVGNYAGVTVGSKMAEFNQGGYSFILTDLPGTYSLSTYSPEELFVRHHMTGNTPDVVINVIDASNLERNFYLTTQLIDMDVPMVIALNMYDELQQSGNEFDYQALGTMLGVPIVPTVGTKGEGIRELFNRVADLYEGRDTVYRHIHITYHSEIEQSIHLLQDLIWKLSDFSDRLSSRFFAIKLLEKDVAAKKELEQLGDTEELWQQCDQEINRLEHLFGDDTESLIADGRYGFIHGALRETLRPGPPPDSKEQTTTERFDRILTHKWFGFPLFLLFLWIMFQSTFNLGKFPVAWIDAGVGILSNWLNAILHPSILKDLLVDGVIGGVGGVIVFLPNIMILFLFISLMEDSGYMARVAFIMDKLMHVLGLHGKSFIPLIMGFGCNVPAIMATRTIEHRNERLTTMLILPLMSCSARLPVYILIAGALFPGSAGNMIFLLYLTGIALSVVVAIVLKNTIFKKQEAPFVMELPPYRSPRLNASLKHMWFRSQQYLKKMGGVILVASVIIWALGYFPHTEGNSAEQQLEHSAIGVIGKTLQPVLSPLGFDWKMTVAVVSGVAAKEVVVSTIGVLYPTDSIDNHLTDRLKSARYTHGPRTGQPVFTKPAGLGFMLFVLIYIPCIAVLATIRREAGGWKWVFLLILYTTTLAWITGWIGYHIGGLIFMS